MVQNSRGISLAMAFLVLTNIAFVFGCKQKDQQPSTPQEATNKNKRNEEARVARTQADLAIISNAISRYEMDIGSYPTEKDGLEALIHAPVGLKNPTKWKGPYIDERELPKDAWGNHFIYRNPGKKEPTGYDLFSAGPNGIPGDGDDVWKP